METFIYLPPIYLFTTNFKLENEIREVTKANHVVMSDCNCPRIDWVNEWSSHAVENEIIDIIDDHALE